MSTGTVLLDNQIFSVTICLLGDGINTFTYDEDTRTVNNLYVHTNLECIVWIV